VGLKIENQKGQTPLDEDEIEGLKVKHISTQQQLNELEQNNVEEAIQWLMLTKIDPNKILSEEFISLLHKKMFDKTWSWAGKFRKSEKNIGVEAWKISVELRYLLDDVNYWIKNKTYSQDEIAIRFKHRLVSIHCFSNGNGRHSRIMADSVMEIIFKDEIFSWGEEIDDQTENARLTYLNALKSADNNDYEPLIRFSRR
jgi:Fic-DOC domain mobile mystery protein B